MVKVKRSLDLESLRLPRPKFGLKIRRRSQSVPARKKRSLIEDYYRVDTEENVVLPGMPTYDEDWQRDIHDFFNLIVLIPVVVLNGLNWNWDVMLSFSNANSKTFEDAWIGEWNNVFYRFAMLYFAVDLTWVLAVPHCVKSPVTIIVHHVVCLAYCSLPLFIPGTYYLMGLNMSVEANTWFLIARRVFNKQGFPPWTISLSSVFSIRIKLISIFFYITWFVIRLIIFPIVLIKLIEIHEMHYEITNKPDIAVILAIMFQVVLCTLNLKWTKDLVMAKVRFWKKGRKESNKGL